MYSGKHFRARLAAACHSSAVGARKQREPYADSHSNPDTYANSDAYANSDPNSYADGNPDSGPDAHPYTHTDPNVGRRRRLCGRMEFHDCISGR